MENLNNATQVLKYRLQQLSWQGQIGALLIAMSLLCIFTVSLPKKQQLQQLQMELAALKNNPKQIVNDIDQHSQLDVAQQFYASLPAKSEMNSKITVVLRAATDNDLVVNKVEYIQPVVTSALTLPIVQYQINFPVQGNYKQIRQFINQVLTRLPSIALNDISLRREDVAVEMVDARIRFTLYLQNGER